MDNHKFDKLSHPVYSLKVDRNENGTLTVSLLRNHRSPHNDDDVGALYYVIAVIFIYGFSIVVMIASYVRKNNEDRHLKRCIKDMAFVRKREEQQSLASITRRADAMRRAESLRKKAMIAARQRRMRLNADGDDENGRDEDEDTLRDVDSMMSLEFSLCRMNSNVSGLSEESGRTWESAAGADSCAWIENEIKTTDSQKKKTRERERLANGDDTKVNEEGLYKVNQDLSSLKVSTNTEGSANGTRDVKALQVGILDVSKLGGFDVSGIDVCRFQNNTSDDVSKINQLSACDGAKKKLTENPNLERTNETKSDAAVSTVGQNGDEGSVVGKELPKTVEGNLKRKTDGSKVWVRRQSSVRFSPEVKDCDDEKILERRSTRRKTSLWRHSHQSDPTKRHNSLGFDTPTCGSNTENWIFLEKNPTSHQTHLCAGEEVLPKPCSQLKERIGARANRSNSIQDFSATGSGSRLIGKRRAYSVTPPWHALEHVTNL